jgi:hypothetical protein
MATIVTALFRSRMTAEQAVDSLLRAGFRREDVSVLMSETTHGREFGIVTRSKAGEGAAAGAATGGAVGAVLAALAAVGSLAIPGIGLIAAGPIVAALAGAGAMGAAGSLVGGLIGAGIPEHEAKFFGPEVERGGILVGVHVVDRDWVDTAKLILRNAGGASLKAA